MSLSSLWIDAEFEAEWLEHAEEADEMEYAEDEFDLDDVVDGDGAANGESWSYSLKSLLSLWIDAELESESAEAADDAEQAEEADDADDDFDFDDVVDGDDAAKAEATEDTPAPDIEEWATAVAIATTLDAEESSELLDWIEYSVDAEETE